MNIIAHRGLFNSEAEPNSRDSLYLALQKGFGIETDVRDYQGKLIISHDPPLASTGILTLAELFQTYNEMGHQSLLALNIKSGGLSPYLKDLLDEYSITNYFVFDMANPDALRYLCHGLKVYDRVSEIESPVFLNVAGTGLWIDQFWDNWYPTDKDNYLDKPRCVVSPELHKRDNYRECWAKLKPFFNDSNLSLCTDFPEEAKAFFYD